MRPTKVFAILAIAGVMFVFSLGVLTSWPVNAQGHDPRYSRNLPFQRDLWQFSANGPTTHDNANSAHIFTVRPEPGGYLPVVTQVYGTNFDIYREVNGSWKLWFRANSGSSPEKYSMIIDTGLVLQPGRYRIFFNGTGSESHELLLSGYWAPR